jgi:hypothetical protein
VSLTAIMARLRPFTCSVLTGGFRRGAVMCFVCQVLPATRHSGYATGDENDGEDRKNDHVEHESVHHSLSIDGRAIAWRRAVP